ncbi:hypothetical protein DY000_02019210 [Brassica cretica]|uniref:EamA domain-containing protein n=1 Tax=Brassica cretica TaxID=69181 RepID=A0ABQ7CVS7_BRACR|nr:hypothetical protein DY000_02019210 [Brassica cretica]
MADKPSRALVLYGDGLARSVHPSNTHIHSLAFIGTCGFLSLPHAPPAETENERIVREFAHLLDASESYTIASGLKAKGSENKISTLFESLKGEIWGWTLFYASVSSLAFGSAYYHLKPDDNRIVWDTLPILIAYSSLFSSFLVERAGERVGLSCLVLLLFISVLSVAYAR